VIYFYAVPVGPKLRKAIDEAPYVCVVGVEHMPAVPGNHDPILHVVGTIAADALALGGALPLARAGVIGPQVLVEPQVALADFFKKNQKSWKEYHHYKELAERGLWSQIGREAREKAQHPEGASPPTEEEVERPDFCPVNLWEKIPTTDRLQYVKCRPIYTQWERMKKDFTNTKRRVYTAKTKEKREKEDTLAVQQAKAINDYVDAHEKELKAYIDIENQAKREFNSDIRKKRDS
jgi:hypothetical protein